MCDGMASSEGTGTDLAEVRLGDGTAMPRLGLGVFQVSREDTAGAVAHALRTGYRAIDTAAAYGNEAEVAEGIAQSGLGRDEVFVTTKLWNRDHGRDEARRACERSLERLGFDHVDLYLIHWPVPSRGRYVETWRALVELRDEGRARAIGVSNFHIEHLQQAIEATGVVPAVNQVELHPRFQQAPLRAFHQERGIVTEAWSPLAQAAVLDDAGIGELASARGRTPAQVVLRWHLQLGNVVIPKSVTPERIEENFAIFDFELDDEAMATIGELDAGDRIGPDPATFTG
jgi:2,5-diketo-D-gluconate reductase A